MRTVLLSFGAFAIIVALPLSWWLAGRGKDNPGVRQMRDHRASMDRLSAGTGVTPPPGGSV